MRLAALILAALQVVAPGAGGGDPFAFFSPSVVLRSGEWKSLQEGTPIASVVQADGRDVAIFSVIPVDRAVDGDRLIAWMRQIASLKQSKYVLALRRFSTPPRLEDLDTLSLDDGDLNEIRRCRPGHCGMKLSTEEIGALQRAVAASGNDWKPPVQLAFRQLILQRVQAYTIKGHGGLNNYTDRGSASSLGLSFSALVGRSPFLTGHVPQFAEYLTRYPSNHPSDIESFVYWSKEKLGNKAVISATHVVITRGTAPAAPEVLVAGKQIFATHYMDASLSVTALLYDGSANRRYLAYLNRSDLDVLGGFWGGLVRRIVERRLKSEAPAVLKQLNERLASGLPPAVAANEPRTP